MSVSLCDRRDALQGMHALFLDELHACSDFDSQENTNKGLWVRMMHFSQSNKRNNNILSASSPHVARTLPARRQASVTPKHTKIVAPKVETATVTPPAAGDIRRASLPLRQDAALGSAPPTERSTPRQHTFPRSSRDSPSISPSKVSHASTPRQSFSGEEAFHGPSVPSSAQGSPSGIDSEYLVRMRPDQPGYVPPAEAPEEPIELFPCEKCGRKFGSGRIDAHRAICTSKSAGARSAFDSHARRTAAIRAVNGSSMLDITPEADRSILVDGQRVPLGPVDADGRVRCNYCHRHFSPAVAERHVPKCAETRNRYAIPLSLLSMCSVVCLCCTFQSKHRPKGYVRASRDSGTSQCRHTLINLCSQPVGGVGSWDIPS